MVRKLSLTHLQNSFLFFFFLLSSQIIWANDYTGRSPYRLIFVEHPNLAIPFDPNEDVLKASNLQKSQELIKDKVLGAVVKGLLPMSGLLGTALSQPQSDFLTSVTSMSSVLSNELNATIESFSSLDARIFPVVNDVYLLPWQTGDRDLFYSADKLSMSPEATVNVLAASSGSEKFEKEVTKQIKDLQKLRFNTENPVYLLGARSFIFINPSGESNLVVSVLLAVKPANVPFTQSNDKVTFERIVIRGSAEKPVTASLTLTLPLGRDEAPVLDVEFGEFSHYSTQSIDPEAQRVEPTTHGVFRLKESGRQNLSPGLEGRSTKGSIPLTFSFSSLRFDLLDLNVSGLKMLTSMGFLTKRGRLPIGGFKVKAVNEQFQQEINNTLDAEVESARNAGLEAVESKVFSDAILKDALEAILGRVK